ncbi:MAG TPA: cyclic nucleotide-binding domain-containing protein [Anaerolineae bacterium]
MATIDLFRNTRDYAAFEAGQIIFERGQPGDVMYAVIDGEVEILLGERVIDAALPGSIIGEMALIDSGSRSATARAKTACKLVPISEKRFMFLVQQTPYFAIQVMRILADRLRRLMHETP